MWNDNTFLTYLALLCVSVFGATIFTWELVRSKKYRNYVFIYIMILFYGGICREIPALYARYLWNVDPAAGREFLSTWIWSAKSYVILIGKFAICAHMTYRAVTRHQNERSHLQKNEK